MVGKGVEGDSNIGPLLAFGAFEEETFLVLPFANASSRLQHLLQNQDSNLEASQKKKKKKKSQSSTAALPAISTVEIEGN